MPQTLGQIKSLLAAHGLHPKHRLGQNFLHDHNKLNAICQAAEIQAGQIVLEVGGGTGTLSLALLDAGAQLVVVEADPDLEPILNQQLVAHGGCFELIIADVLAGKHELNPLVVEALNRANKPADDSKQLPFKMVANLPYNTASPLLANLVSDYPAMSDAVVTIQREVADRLLAPPGGKQYGPLGVLIQAMCKVQKIASMPPGCFWPQPQVESMAIKLTRLAQPLTDDPKNLSQMLQRVFSKRRKQLGAILGKEFPMPEGINSRLRPQDLSVAQLVALADAGSDRTNEDQ
jgi:16S rRNA (adenine1518-N6/adenine1519-N6)-dimethyltransferase